MTGEYKVRNDDIIPLHKAAIKLVGLFESFHIEHVLRSKNTHADTLASLAANLAQPTGTTQRVTVASRKLFRLKDVLEANATHQTPDQPDQEDWRLLIVDYVLYGMLTEDARERDSIRRQAQEALREAHDSTCGAHQPVPKLWDRLRRIDYFWPGMVIDAVAYAKCCHEYQIHANYMHQPPEDLHPTKASWPFEAWGMDIVGPISPPSARGHRFILAITDYFSKWAKAVPLREVKTNDVIKFIKHHVIYRYGIPPAYYS
ncbi:uncharacterized protein A4U43_C07F30570 [Asparagus officinalis]|uniref:Integrase catalytic domain-containing protein n=1 Tax=Asparagus officinalis TaxID=4686 RepID=A0A5P1EG80_ASPOF|nr:uncharacterized protein A4U43_C07F30570 [Asparagus officinalis]